MIPVLLVRSSKIDDDDSLLIDDDGTDGDDGAVADTPSKVMPVISVHDETPAETPVATPYVTRMHSRIQTPIMALEESPRVQSSQP